MQLNCELDSIEEQNEHQEEFVLDKIRSKVKGQGKKGKNLLVDWLIKLIGIIRLTALPQNAGFHVLIQYINVFTPAKCGISYLDLIH
jgi:hypothetical protein